MQAARPSRSAPRPTGAVLWTTRLDRNSRISLSRQLAASLRRAIAEGGLTAAARLPSSRALAAELGLARSTVMLVFEQLATEGYIAARPGSGYFVAAVAGRSLGLSQPTGAVSASRRLSRQGALLRSVPASVRGTPLPFELGHVEIDGRMIMTWKRLAARLLSGRTHIDWGYGDHQGEARLRGA